MGAATVTPAVAAEFTPLPTYSGAERAHNYTRVLLYKQARTHTPTHKYTRKYACTRARTGAQKQARKHVSSKPRKRTSARPRAHTHTQKVLIHAEKVWISTHHQQRHIQERVRNKTVGGHSTAPKAQIRLVLAARPKT